MAGGNPVPRIIGDNPETRRLLDDLQRARSLFSGVMDAAAATALLNVFTDILKGLVPASGGGTANFLRADGTFAAPASAVRQCLQTTYATNADLTTVIPGDDTTPLISEGTEVLSLAITPADNTNKVLAEVVVWGAIATGNNAIAVSLFRGATCIDAKQHTFPTANFPAEITMKFLDSPASAGAQTYSVRVGPTLAVTARLNGSAVGRLFGGTAVCTLTLQEIEA